MLSGGQNRIELERIRTESIRLSELLKQSLVSLVICHNHKNNLNSRMKYT